MQYTPEEDTYPCANGKQLHADYIRHTRSLAGFPIETIVCTCRECQGCPLKERCIKGYSKTPLEERNKTLYVSRRCAEQRARMEVSVNSALGVSTCQSQHTV